MKRNTLRGAIGACLAAILAMVALAPTADASHRAGSTRGGFDAIVAWFADLVGGENEADSGVRMDPNG